MMYFLDKWLSFVVGVRVTQLTTWSMLLGFCGLVYAFEVTGPQGEW